MGTVTQLVSLLVYFDFIPHLDSQIRCAESHKYMLGYWAVVVICPLQDSHSSHNKCDGNGVWYKQQQKKKPQTNIAHAVWLGPDLYTDHRTIACKWVVTEDHCQSEVIRQREMNDLCPGWMRKHRSNVKSAGCGVADQWSTAWTAASPPATQNSTGNMTLCCP